jgi:hypothetical protein
MRGDLERLDPDAVARHLVVEGEPLAGVPDLAEAARLRDPARLARADRRERPLLLVGRFERIAREQVLEVGEDELLVLLFVLQSELEQVGRHVVRGEQLENGVIDVTPVREHVVEARAREHAALGARVLVAYGVVIGIEQYPVRRVEALVARPLREQEGFKEPGGVREVPLRRARVGHRLQRAILGRKSGRESERCTADGAIARARGCFRRRCWNGVHARLPGSGFDHTARDLISQSSRMARSRPSPGTRAGRRRGGRPGGEAETADVGRQTVVYRRHPWRRVNWSVRYATTLPASGAT